MPVEEAICINPESFPIKILHFLICAATSIKFNLPQKFLILFFFKCLIIFFVFFLSFEEPKKTIDFFFPNFFYFKKSLETLLKSLSKIGTCGKGNFVFFIKIASSSNL